MRQQWFITECDRSSVTAGMWGYKKKETHGVLMIQTLWLCLSLSFWKETKAGRLRGSNDHTEIHDCVSSICLFLSHFHSGTEISGFGTGIISFLSLFPVISKQRCLKSSLVTHSGESGNAAGKEIVLLHEAECRGSGMRCISSGLIRVELFKTKQQQQQRWHRRRWNISESIFRLWVMCRVGFDMELHQSGDQSNAETCMKSRDRDEMFYQRFRFSPGGFCPDWTREERRDL